MPDKVAQGLAAVSFDAITPETHRNPPAAITALIP